MRTGGGRPTRRLRLPRASLSVRLGIAVGLPVLVVSCVLGLVVGVLASRAVLEREAIRQLDTAGEFHRVVRHTGGHPCPAGQ